MCYCHAKSPHFSTWNGGNPLLGLTVQSPSQHASDTGPRNICPWQTWDFCSQHNGDSLSMVRKGEKDAPIQDVLTFTSQILSCGYFLVVLAA